MELTRAERQVDYVSDSGDKNKSAFWTKKFWQKIILELSATR